MATKNSKEQGRPDMELAVAQLASIIAELMRFSKEQIEEIQVALIESCINAFEHSQTTDRQVKKYIMRTDELEFKISTSKNKLEFKLLTKEAT